MEHNLSENLKNLEKLFESRLSQYEEKLLKATSTSGTATVSPDITALSREFTEFKSFICQALKSIKSQLDLLTVSHDRHEMVMRRKVLLFHGMPETQGGDLTEEVHILITKQLKLPEITRDRLNVCHRLGSPSSKIRPVLVRFYDFEHRRLVWESKTALKGTGVTISEFLTRLRHSVFTSARKHFGIKNCWSVEGRIVISLPDKSRRRIETESELQAVIAMFPSSAGAAEEQSSPKATEGAAASRGARKARRRV